MDDVINAKFLDALGRAETTKELGKRFSVDPARDLKGQDPITTRER